MEDLEAFLNKVKGLKTQARITGSILREVLRAWNGDQDEEELATFGPEVRMTVEVMDKARFGSDIAVLEELAGILERLDPIETE